MLNSRIEDVSPDRWAGEYDVVTVLDVLEHLPEPLLAVRKIARWVRPSGGLLVRGPLSNSRMTHLKEGVRRRFKLMKQLPGYPLDANVFNKRSMSAMLGACGFRCRGMDQ